MFRLVMSFDDGARDDIKLVRLLKTYVFKAIFFIPNSMNGSDDYRLPVGGLQYLVNEGFELGGHTKTHSKDMKRMDIGTQIEEISYNKGYLEGLTGKDIEWFCYPSGRYNEDTIKAVKLAGFKYARTVLVGNYKKPTDNFKIVTSVHIYPNREEYKGKHWLEYAFDILEKASKEPDGYFHVWGHSWELQKFGLWEDVEKLFKKIKEYDYVQ